ncbi:MAG: MBL fold metallo-hydrolase [Candidatus Lokiarchaeota archaeon]|nr:MBL fold metallo-hydrolase [Candidatus Lokiarchaeota archaeon]
MTDFIEQLADKIYFIRGLNNGRIPYSNSVLYGNVLIDTGISKNHLLKLKKRFKIEQILFSHWHEDHTRDNGLFESLNRSCHELEKRVIENTDLFIRNYDVNGTPAEQSFKNYLFNSLEIKNSRIDAVFKDEDVFNNENDLSLKVIHTPGHSAGHCCFYETRSRTTFLGDIDLSKFGPWYGCLDSNLEDFIDSINRLEHLDMDACVAGHTGLTMGRKLIRQKLTQYKSIIYSREKKILEHLHEKRPMLPEDLMQKKIIYKKYHDFFYSYLLVAEKIMLQKHFEKLMSQKVILEENGGYLLG